MSDTSTTTTTSSTTSPTSITTTSTSTTSTSTTSTSTSTSTSSTSTTSTTSSTTSSSTSSTTSSTSSTSSTTSLLTSPTTTVPPLTTGPTTTRGSVVTSTSFSIVTQSNTATSTEGASGGSKGFFDNTGAVAGVFSVVGLIGLVILIALVTNGIRRRRAKKFDREIAEAAREAAQAQPPAFLDDDDDLYGGRGGRNNVYAPGDAYTTGYDASSGGYEKGAAAYGAGGAYGAAERGYNGGNGTYSDTSHGTFSQPALNPNPNVESYGMREFPQPQPQPYGGPQAQFTGAAPGEVFDYNNIGGAAGNAAGVGVARARSMQRADGVNYGQALTEGASPYAAFAAPGVQPGVVGAGVAIGGAPQPAMNSNDGRGEQSGTYAMYDSGPYPSRALSVSKSTASPPPGYPTSSASQFSPTSSNGYPSSNTSYPPNTYPPTSNQGYPPNASGNAYSGSASNAHSAPDTSSRYSQGMDDDDVDAYGGYVVSDDPPVPAPVATGATGATGGKGATATSGKTKEDVLPNPFAADDRDEEDEPRRVLKVANQ